MRRIIINTLNKLGYQEVLEAANGREGIDRLTTSEIDLVITDWNMGPADAIRIVLESLDLYRKLRRGELGKGPS